MKITLLIILTAIIYSCCPEPKELTTEDIQKEKDAIVKVLQAYNRAAEDKNFSAMVETLAGEVIFYGTDSSEIITTFADYKKQMLQQWEQYDKMVYGELSNVSIQLDEAANFASAIYGMTVDLTRKGTTERLFLRAARTLKKENERWVIVTGIVGIARTGESVSPAVIDTSKTQ